MTKIARVLLVASLITIALSVTGPGAGVYYGLLKVIGPVLFGAFLIVRAITHEMRGSYSRGFQIRGDKAVAVASTAIKPPPTHSGFLKPSDNLYLHSFVPHPERETRSSVQSSAAALAVSGPNDASPPRFGSLQALADSPQKKSIPTDSATVCKRPSTSELPDSRLTRESKRSTRAPWWRFRRRVHCSIHDVT
jgi:hypothetical protein